MVSTTRACISPPPRLLLACVRSRVVRYRYQRGGAHWNRHFLEVHADDDVMVKERKRESESERGGAGETIVVDDV